jgi:hypothetical protein
MVSIHSITCNLRKIAAKPLLRAIPGKSEEGAADSSPGRRQQYDMQKIDDRLEVGGSGNTPG